MRRTRTLVSTARIAFLDAPPDPVFHLAQSSGLRCTLREQCAVDVERGKAARAPHDDVIAVFIPFQDRAWTNAQFPANAGGDGNLTLCREFGIRECHALILPR